MSTDIDGEPSLAAFLAEEGAEAEQGPPPLWEAGRTVGEWKVTAFLARGGNAETYCAKHLRLGKAAALKVLWRNDAGPRERFEREVRFLMENPGASFPAFYGTGVDGGRPWAAMELLDECPLPGKDAEVAAYLEDVGKGLEFLHGRGWVHRDLKPRNILRRVDGHAVLIDFGLLKEIGGVEKTAARVSPSVVDGREVGVGTPGYSAPEQFAGGAVTPATDVYAMGMLADECFGGNPPRAWEDIIRRATGALPRQRYASVAEMLWDVRRRNRGRNWRRAGLLALLAAAGVAAAVALRPGGGGERPAASGSKTREIGRELDGGPAPVSEREVEAPGMPEPEPPVNPLPPARDSIAEAPSPLAREQDDGAVADSRPSVQVVQIPEIEQLRLAARLEAELGRGASTVAGIIQDVVPLPVPVISPGSDEVAWDVSRLISRHEVTQAQWETLMQVNPSRFKGADLPVDNVTIFECLEFISRLNALPAVRDAGLAFRLPTKEEWQEAAREPGNGNDWNALARGRVEAGWFLCNSDGTTHPVGQKAPNPKGLFDMWGNVAEPVTPPDPEISHSDGGAGLRYVPGNDGTQRPVFLSFPCMGGSIRRNNPFNDQLFFVGGNVETLSEEARDVFGKMTVLGEAAAPLLPDDPRRASEGGETLGLRLAADALPPAK